MKNYIQFIKESSDIDRMWFNAIREDNQVLLKYLIEQGYDINTIEGFVGTTGLYSAVYSNKRNVFDLLIKQPNIIVNCYNEIHQHILIAASNFKHILKTLLLHPDIKIKDEDGTIDFLDYTINFPDVIKELKEYNFQKELLNSNRIDILLYFKQYDILNKKLKKENPDLFKAAEWGLIS